MSTGFEQLALSIAEDCNRAQVRRVQIATAICIAIQILVFGSLAAATVFGALIGLVIVALARHGARKVRNDICDSSFVFARRRSEVAGKNLSEGAASRNAIVHSAHRTLVLSAKVFGTFGIAHLCLSQRLLPAPVAMRA